MTTLLQSSQQVQDVKKLTDFRLKEIPLPVRDCWMRKRIMKKKKKVLII